MASGCFENFTLAIENLGYWLGKQQLAWGKMDGQFIDIVNGMDKREFVQLESDDYEIRRLPTWMANSTFYFGNNTTTFICIRFRAR